MPVSRGVAGMMLHPEFMTAYARLAKAHARRRRRQKLARLVLAVATLAATAAGFVWAIGEVVR